jgi:hypothetical protein
MNKWIFIENMFTVFVAGAMVVGLYWLSGSFHSFWALVILFNLNSYS